MNKTKILSLILIFIMLGGLLTLTGCGNEDTKSKKKNDNITKALNEAVETIEKEAEKKSTTPTYNVSTIQKALEDRYQLINASREAFTEAPDKPTKKFKSLQYSEQLINVGANYVMVYDKETENYYSVKVSYSSYQPTFSNAKKLSNK